MHAGIFESKSDKNRSDYDLVMEHQLDQKRKTLEGLK